MRPKHDRRRRRRSWLFNVALGCALLVPGGAAWAQETSSDWEFTVTPYLWMTGFGMETRGVGPIPSQDVDVDFSQVWDHLNFAFEGNVEARKDRFVANFDFNYFDLAADEGLSGLVFTKAGLEMTGILSSATVGYQAVASDSVSMEIFGGAQLFSVDTSLALRGGGSPSASDKETFIDPVVGLRGRVHLGEDFFLDGVGAIGGFGVDSKITYQLFGGIGWQVNDSIALRAGYRHFYIEQEGGKLIKSVTMTGPIIGASFQF